MAENQKPNRKIMEYYIEIELRPDSEFTETVLMNEIYFRLHKVLGQQGHCGVGVSFPRFKKTLGNCLRLHSEEAALKKIMSSLWLKGIEDYVLVSHIREVPKIIKYRTVQRIQIKSSIDRLLRRSVRRGSLTESAAKARLENNTGGKKTSLPFIKLKSLSTGQKFCLFIEHGEIVDNPVPGEFSSYGLSSKATIPWF